MFSFFHLIFSLLLLCCFLHFSPHLAVRTNHSIICADPYYDEGSRPIIISIFDHHHLHLRPLCSLSLSSLSQSMWFLSQKFLGACMLILAREIEGKHEENRGSWTTQFLKKNFSENCDLQLSFPSKSSRFWTQDHHEHAPRSETKKVLVLSNRSHVAVVNHLLLRWASSENFQYVDIWLRLMKNTIEEENIKYYTKLRHLIRYHQWYLFYYILCIMDGWKIVYNYFCFTEFGGAFFFFIFFITYLPLIVIQSSI